MAFILLGCGGSSDAPDDAGANLDASTSPDASTVADAAPGDASAPVSSDAGLPPRSSLGTDGWFTRIADQEPDPFTQAAADALVARLSESELRRLGELDWEATDETIIHDPLFRTLLDVTAAELDRAYPPDTAISPITFPGTQMCFDTATTGLERIRDALRPLRESGTLGLALAATCYAAITPGPQLLVAIATCAVGVAVMTLVSWGAVATAGASVESAWNDIKSACDAECGGEGQPCCAEVPGLDRCDDRLECVGDTCVDVCDGVTCGNVCVDHPDGCYGIVPASPTPDGSGGCSCEPIAVTPAMCGTMPGDICVPCVDGVCQY